MNRIKKQVSEVKKSPVSHRDRSPSALSQLVDRAFSFIKKSGSEPQQEDHAKTFFYTSSPNLKRNRWDAELSAEDSGMIHGLGDKDLAFIVTGIKSFEDAPKDKFGFCETPHFDGLFFYTLIDGPETLAVYSRKKISADSDFVVKEAQYSDAVLVEMPRFPSFNIDYHQVQVQLLERKCNHYQRLSQILAEQSNAHLKQTRKFSRALIQKEQENDELRKQNHLDEMTGLRNQRALNKDKSEHILSSLESKVPLYIGFGDIENFKRYNSDYGHKFGDQVMKGIGRAVSDATRRDGEYAYRRGSDGADEMVFVLRNKTPSLAVQTMSTIKRNVYHLRLTPEQGLLDSGDLCLDDQQIVKVYMDLGLVKFDPRSLIDQQRPSMYGTDKDWYRKIFDDATDLARQIAIKNKKSDSKRLPMYHKTYEALMTQSGEDLIEDDSVLVN